MDGGLLYLLFGRIVGFLLRVVFCQFRLPFGAEIERGRGREGGSSRRTSVEIGDKDYSIVSAVFHGNVVADEAVYVFFTVAVWVY